ncbi:sigma-70 family RNA polymerase sigma factor [Thiomonas sp.]|jgi:RNA polymerase sigma-70 factor (ECF subfamily)|uniref:sigma-70 family RNA polymerase sigma factor n=1 Tax=Thiomonas sp. TaxID=2047785 RepID=UPI00262EF901|nr:sigma-70 family RNA polymerase sigma factor [Thiomonas sp.]
MADRQQLLIEQIPHLRRYARVLTCGRAADADDLVQDTLERALAKWGLWRGAGSVRPWLFSIMHNLFADQCAGAARGAGMALDELPEPLHPQQPAAQELRLQALQLIDALQRLPLPQREVLLLVAVEGMSYAEVARTLGVPQGTVMSRLSRARTQLWQLSATDAAQPRPALRVIEGERTVG